MRLPAALWALTLAVAGFGLSEPIQAQDPDDPSPFSDAWLVSEVSSIQAGVPFTVAVRFEMDPGWHNYWLNSGDTGFPTAIDWALPEGFTAGGIQWPVPERYEYLPLVDYVYSDSVALMVEILPPGDLEPGGSVTLNATVDWLICHDVCLPAFADLSLEIPVADAPPSLDPYWEDLFREARNRLPKSLDDWSATAEVVGSGYRLTIRPPHPDFVPPDSVYFFPAEGDVLDHAASQPSVAEGGTLTLTLASSPYASGPVSTLEGVLKAVEGGSWDPDSMVQGLWIVAPVSGPTSFSEDPAAASEGTPPPAEHGAVGGYTLTLALVFAFLGGILLNLMPCVFPILSLKVLGAASQGGEERERVRNQGAMFALGVVLSFLALGGLLIVLRAGGAQLGWGFQLQSPYFVGFMSALFFAIGLNLMGLFEVGGVLTRLGGRLGDSGGYGESLASGALATLIATPCTAPFMGAALGFALTRSIPETLLIFASLGVGMALPYLILAVAPGLLERLPRPGPWMETQRQILAFPMFATVIWLVWVFGQQTGVGGATYLLTALLLITAAGWMVGRWHRTDHRSGLVARATSLAILAGAVGLVVRGSGQDAPPAAIGDGWQPFSQVEIEGTLAQGRPAFVDFTAAWCLTCQVNERVVLSTETIRQAFNTHDVTLFKADWTRQDPEITEALEALGRSGVPVYALYRGAPGESPHLLPSILTEQIVLNALEEVLSP